LYTRMPHRVLAGMHELAFPPAGLTRGGQNS
jgi:hypothetical protein